MAQAGTHGRGRNTTMHIQWDVYLGKLEFFFAYAKSKGTAHQIHRNIYLNVANISSHKRLLVRRDQEGL